MGPDLIELLQSLVEGDVRFLIVGGFAVIHHAEPRYTKDLDILIATDRENAERVKKILVEFGAPVASTDVSFFMDTESFLIIGFPPNKIDILMSIPGVTFADAYERRVEMRVDNLKLPVIGLDDLINAKQASGRPQDLIDVQVLQTAKRLKG